MQELKDEVKKLLEQGSIAGFLGMIATTSGVVPHLFVADKADEIEKLTTGDVRYSLVQILRWIAVRHPDDKFGIMCRACDERAMTEMFRNSQLSMDKVVMLGIPCTDELRIACECEEPTPKSLLFGQSTAKKWDKADVERIDAMETEERLDWWTEQLGKCIKCYGCRNSCPMCFCRVCTLNDDPLVKRGEIPSEFPSFHLTRAFHMAGRCVDCGLCEEACPMDIPIRTIYRKVRLVVGELTNFWTGESKGKSPLAELGDGTFPIQ